MKKLLLAFACLCLPLLLHAELKQLKISGATASSVETENASATEGPAQFAIDGNSSTFWSAKWSDCNKYPVTFTITLADASHVDVLRYVPRTGNVNGNWDKVKVSYALSSKISTYVTLGEFSLGGSGNPYVFPMGENGVDDVKKIRFTINSGANGYATAAEIEAYAMDNSSFELWQTYFKDPLFTELKPGVTSSEGIENATLKALVDNLLADAEGYKKFRVAEYEPYRDIYSLQKELKTSNPYNKWENPSGVYLKEGEECYVVVSGITTERVGLKIKNWYLNENGSSYLLGNGLNKITASTEGNVFVDYYTDNYETAPNVKVHFVNAPVRGYWDQATMTNEDWKDMLSPFDSDDKSIIIVRSQHAQLAYPVCAWKQYCPENIDSLMNLYQQVQWAERYMMGLDKYGRQAKNRQLFFASNYSFMAATEDGAFCNVTSLESIMRPDAMKFGFWAVGHEWGHINQIDGFKWSGCGETTNNIYASWAEIMFNHQEWCRLEDEISGIEEYAGIRGGRMQTYFEEALRKGVQWQLQDGPDYYGTAPVTKTVGNYDYDGNYIGTISAKTRNYDHFVKLTPFWQMNLWGNMAGKCPDIIPMIIESIRRTDNYKETYNTNGKQQVNFMKLACDSAKLNLLPFFEKAGMLRPISAYIEDYGPGWNKISQTMINNLKIYVASKGYPEVTEELNYITAHNYKIYRDKLPLTVGDMNAGCVYNSGKVIVSHATVKNAVAYETYNANDELIRITMYALGSDASHSYTQVLYPSSTEEEEAAAYIMAVGFDGTRKKIYEMSNMAKGMQVGKYYTITNSGRGNALSSGASTSIAQDGTITWSISRVAKNSAAMEQLWTVEKDGSNYYIINPQSGMYLPGTVDEEIKSLVPKSDASTWTIQFIGNDIYNDFIFKSNTLNRYLNASSTTATGYWTGGAYDENNCWTVEEVTTVSVSIPTNGYIPACYPVPVELPDGLTAYVIGEISSRQYGEDTYDYAVMDEVQGNLIPACMPVILNGPKGSYKLNIHPKAVASIDMPNLLKGATMKIIGIAKSTAMYTVSSSTEAGTAVMMKPSTATSIPKNRAYMLTTDLDDPAQLYLQTRDNLSTGIADVENNDMDAYSGLYDLNGVRVFKPQRGRVYVTSAGRKVIIM